MSKQPKARALISALSIQFCIIGLIFIGGLLDPLVALWIAGIYFFIVGTYLTYRVLLSHLIHSS